MGTRGNVVVQDADGRGLVRIYRQFDTYPSGMGRDLKSILGGARIVNGFGFDDEAPATFNGMGCLAAYLVGALKGSQIGNVYVLPMDDEPDGIMIEYVYTLWPESDGIHVRVDEAQGPNRDDTPATFGESEAWRSKYATLYEGPLADFDPERIER